MILFQQRLSVFPVDQGCWFQKMPKLKFITLPRERSTKPRRKEKDGSAGMSLQTSASAGSVDKKLEGFEDAEMIVSNDITAILGYTR